MGAIHVVTGKKKEGRGVKKEEEEEEEEEEEAATWVCSVGGFLIGTF